MLNSSPTCRLPRFVAHHEKVNTERLRIPTLTTIIASANLTPFDLKGNLQEEILREHIQDLVKAKVNALAVLGSVGEGTSMPVEMRKRAAEIIIETVRKRLPVIVMTGAADTFTTIELSKHAEKIGADGIYVVPPYYYVPDSLGLIDHFRRVATAVNVPTFVYNIPEFTKINISADMFLELIKIPGIAGIKLSTYDLTQLEDCVELADGRVGIFNGKDSLVLASSVAGARGHFSAICAAIPELFVKLWGAFTAGDLKQAREYQRRINTVRRMIATYPPYESLKEIVRFQGKSMGHVRPPLRLLTRKETRNLHKELSRLEFLKRG